MVDKKWNQKFSSGFGPPRRCLRWRVSSVAGTGARAEEGSNSDSPRLTRWMLVISLDIGLLPVGGGVLLVARGRTGCEEEEEEGGDEVHASLAAVVLQLG